MDTNGIPLKIHYVWMGGAKKPELVLRCIESWKKYMPEYEIIEWNESNFDVNMMDYTREAYEQKKWAFVSDVVRTYALNTYGGIYFDTDVELFSAPKEIFCIGDVVLGFDTEFLLSTGVMATVPHHPVFEKLWCQYTTACFTNANTEETINTRLTFIVIDYIQKKRIINGEHLIRNIKIYPREYFSNNGTMKTPPVFAVHYFTGTWKTKTELTFWQYVMFAGQFKILHLCSKFMSTKKYIKTTDSMWRTALKKTEINTKKNAKIYKIL